MTAVKREDYLFASMVFVGYLVAALVLVIFMGLIFGSVAPILGFFVGILFTVSVYRTWNSLSRRSTR